MEFFRDNKGYSVIWYALATFLGSFLYFQIQPILCKMIIPSFGGSPAVWTSCMLFFQILLIGGYGYVAGVVRLSSEKQVVFPLIFLMGSFFFLPTELSINLAATNTHSPVASILLLLGLSVGVPGLLLASSAPLLQSWYYRSAFESSPWKLYAFSNAGSLLALLSYPVLIEPRLAIEGQLVLWKSLYLIYFLLCGLCAIPLLRQKGASEERPAQQGPFITCSTDAIPPRYGDALVVFLCAAAGSALLLAITEQISLQIAPVPFLWVVPFSMYLGTYILCFSSRRSFARVANAGYLLTAFLFTPFILTIGESWPITSQVVCFLAILGSSCMLCHGEMVRLRPSPDRLANFYLLMAVGGCAGGVFVTLIAPIIFKAHVEMPFLVLAAVSIHTISFNRRRADNIVRHRLFPLAGTAVLVLLVFSCFNVMRIVSGGVEYRRNFFGTLQVALERDMLGSKLNLAHGVTIHGSQYTDPFLRNQPTMYFGPETAVGRSLSYYHTRALSEGAEGVRVGIIGLGAGTLATYSRPGDIFRFYEINPDVVDIAGQSFSFLRDSKARVETVTGDARTLLEQELRAGNTQRFDVLIVDAFNGDSIPVHLMTREALSVYLRHLATGGSILFNISNRMLDLMPVLVAHGSYFGLKALEIVTPGDPSHGLVESTWALLIKNSALINSPEMAGIAHHSLPRGIVWTDKFASIWQVRK